MRVYKRTAWQLAKRLFTALTAAGLMWALLYGARQVVEMGRYADLAQYGAPALLLLLSLYAVLFKENIRCEIGPEGELCYYRMGRCVCRYTLADAEVSLFWKKETGWMAAGDRALKMQGPGNPPEILDCEPLSPVDFKEMYGAIMEHKQPTPEKA